MTDWIVDVREPDSMVKRFNNMGAEVIMMDVGDYAYLACGFERKKDDFSNFEDTMGKVGELKHVFTYPYLLVEGNLNELVAKRNSYGKRNMTTPILAMTASLCASGVTPLFCSNQDFLFMLMKMIAEKTYDGKDRGDGFRMVKTREYNKDNDAISILMGFPGISKVRAEIILAKYKTLRVALYALMSRTTKELVDDFRGTGIGKGTIEKIRKVL